jgi:uncharacterized membrane protein
MNVLLWALQLLFGAYFVAVGVMHFVVPAGLPPMMSWMYELDGTLHAISGTAEILGGLGLILPGLTRILPVLTVWAAIGLTAVMILAAVWHVGRGEAANIAINIVVAVVLGFIAYRRATANRIAPRAAAAG